MVPLVFAFVIGLSLCCQLSQLPPLPWFLLAIVVGGISWVLSFRFVAMLLWGIAWAGLNAFHTLQQTLPDNLERQDILVQGKISSIPAQFAGGIRFNFEVERVLEPPDAPIPERVRLSWYSHDHQPRLGQRWQFRLRLKKPNGSMNPGSYDFERWMFLKQIRATGYVRPGQQNNLLEEPSYAALLSNFRQSLASFFENKLDSPFAGFYEALTLGVKGQISFRQWDVLRDTGTTHLMAISGLHVGLLATLFFFLGRYFWPLSLGRFFSLSSIQGGALFAILGAIIYAAIAGFSIPTQRALIMISIVMVGLLLKRVVRPSNILSLAMLLVTIYDPFAVLEAGFWLSFFAVALIGYVTHGRLARLNYWNGLTRLQLVVTIGLIPMLLFYFQEAPLLGPLVNLFAIPVFSFLIVPLSLLASFITLFSQDLASTLFHGVDYIFSPVWSGICWVSELPLAHISRGAAPFWSLFLALVGTILWFAPRGFPCRYLSLFFWLPVFFVPMQKPAEGGVWFSLLDVGQGLAAVVQTRNHTLLYDTGPSIGKSTDMARIVVLPFLRAQGINRLDAVIVSHGDDDHSGGLRTVLENTNVSALLMSQSIPGLSAQWRRDAKLCHGEQRWVWDSVLFEILAPTSQTPSGDNNQSCVLKISALGGSVLLPGDVEWQAEKAMVKESGELLRSNLLVVPHHGSATSSSIAFLRKVSPDFALISAGYQNRYGFPTEEALWRLKKVNPQIKILETSELGVIQFRLGRGRIWRMPNYRRVAGHFWNRLPGERLLEN